MPTSQIKITVADDAFGEAILVIAPFISSLPPAYQPFLTQATSNLIQNHLLPQLNTLEQLTSPLPFAPTSTIVYGALPPILESVRRTAHDLRGCQFEQYCYENGIDGSNEIAMNELWQMCEVVWDKAYFAAVGTGIKFGDALMEVAKATELRNKQKNKEGGPSDVGKVTTTVLGRATEAERAADLKCEFGEARKAFEAAMEIVGKQEVVEELWGAATDERVEGGLQGEEDGNGNDGRKPVDLADLKPQPGNYDKVDTYDWAVTAHKAVSTFPKEISETHTHAHVANAVPLSTSNANVQRAVNTLPDDRVSTTINTRPAPTAATKQTTPAAHATDIDDANPIPAATPQATTTRTARKRPGAAPKKRIRWEMEYRPAALAKAHGAGASGAGANADVGDAAAEGARAEL